MRVYSSGVVVSNQSSSGFDDKSEASVPEERVDVSKAPMAQSLAMMTSLSGHVPEIMIDQ